MKSNALLTALIAIILLSTSCKKEAVSTAATNTNAESLASNNEIARSYPFCRIGSQKWMSVNLETTQYANGEHIPQCKNAKKWAALTTGAWCWVGFDSVKYGGYGKLYNFYAVHDLRGLAPNGWHIPTRDEMAQLKNFILGESFLTGGRLKEAGFDHWLSPNLYASDSYGFSALGAGLAEPDGSELYLIGESAYFWSSTISPSGGGGFVMTLGYKSAELFVPETDGVGAILTCGFSVRCIRNPK